MLPVSSGSTRETMTLKSSAADSSVTRNQPRARPELYTNGI